MPAPSPVVLALLLQHSLSLLGGDGVITFSGLVVPGINMGGSGVALISASASVAINRWWFESTPLTAVVVPNQ